MKAETAYNVIQALPETEKQRLYNMLGITKKPKAVKKKEDAKFLTLEQCTEMILKQLTERRNKKYGLESMKVV